MIHAQVRNPVFEIFVSVGHKTQLGVKTLEIFLGRDMNWPLAVHLSGIGHGKTHEFAAKARTAHLGCRNHSAYGHATAREARRQNAGIGHQLSFGPALHMMAVLVQTIGIEIRAVLLHHKNPLTKGQNGIQHNTVEC